MKKLTKEQIEKRNKIKQYLLRSLHIVCYILSALFIIVCIAVGIQSCNSKKNNGSIVNKNFESNLPLMANGTKFPYYYSSIFNSSYNTVSLNLQNALLKEGFPTYDVNVPSGIAASTTIYYSKLYTSLYLYSFDNEEFVQIDNVQIYFRTYLNSNDNQTYWRSLQIKLILHNGDDVLYFNRTGPEIDNNVMNFNHFEHYSNKFYASDNIYEDVWLEYMFNRTTPFSFVMRYELNYYWWANTKSQTGIDSQLDIINSSVFMNINTYYDLIIDTGYFISNNRLYNRMVLRYAPLVSPYAPVKWVMPDGTKATLSASNGYGMFGYLAYENTESQALDIVYKRDSVVFEENGVVEYYQTNNCSWVNESWRHLDFANSFDEGSETYMKIISLNGVSSLSPYTGGINDIFTLMKTTFGSILPILNLAILPNFTIGMLLVIPLAVTSIIVIVRLVKK